MFSFPSLFLFGIDGRKGIGETIKERVCTEEEEEEEEEGGPPQAEVEEKRGVQIL